MAIGIARNAQAALRLIGPSAERCLDQAGAVPMKGVKFMLAKGEDGSGNMADEVDETVQGKRLTSIVHRVQLLEALLADIPEERMHASKKLQRIEQDNSLTVYFTDGTTHECDVLIGADGIHSIVRKFVLGENDAAASPQNSGAWFLMTLQPFDKAQASLGKDLVDLDDAREYGWAGRAAFLMHNILISLYNSPLLLTTRMPSTGHRTSGNVLWVQTRSKNCFRIGLPISGRLSKR